MTNHPFTYRQGDVLIVAVEKIPADLKPVPRENGRVVLAHGEVTGHCHAIDDPAVLFLESDLGEMADRFLIVDQECTVSHDEHHPITLASRSELAAAGFEGLAVRRQKEYSPEQIRQVAD